MTAVEWLIDKIKKHYIINNGSLNPTVVIELKIQAKEMEKEQKQSDYMRGWNDGYQNKVKNPFNDNPKSE